MSEAETAQAQADECWAAHERARGPLRDELRELLRGVEGVTGLQPGPGADNLVDRFLDFAEFHSAVLADAADARTAALQSQEARDAAKAAEPPEPTKPPPAMLTEANASDARKWLRDANDNDVRDALNAILDTAEQEKMARQLMKWARADGTTAQVLAAINEKITSDTVDRTPMDAGDAVAQVGGSSTYSTDTTDMLLSNDALTNANAENEPASDAPLEEIVTWVGGDVDRARVRYDAEVEGGQRPDVLAALVDVLDTGNNDEPPA